MTRLEVDIPHVAFPGPHPQSHFWRSAASHVRGGYTVGGSNLTRAVATLLESVAGQLLDSERAAQAKPSGHTVTITLDAVGVSPTYQWTCLEPEGADCRLVPDCDCESYGPLHADPDGRKYHLVDGDDGPEVKHWMHPYVHGCNVCDWLDNSDVVGEDMRGTVSFTVPFTPHWVGDYYEWEPVK